MDKNNGRTTIPKWLSLILTVVLGFFTVFGGAWSGLRAFENQQVKAVKELNNQIETVRTQVAQLSIECKLADQHSTDMIELNRQVRLEQLNTLNAKLDELKGLLQSLIDNRSDHVR